MSFNVMMKLHFDAANLLFQREPTDSHAGDQADWGGRLVADIMRLTLELPSLQLG